MKKLFLIIPILTIGCTECKKCTQTSKEWTPQLDLVQSDTTTFQACTKKEQDYWKENQSYSEPKGSNTVYFHTNCQ